MTTGADGKPRERVPNEVRRARTRSAILDAAEAQIVERGFASTTIDGLAPDAGVSKGAVYFHFGSKDALLEALLDRSQQTVFAPALSLLDDRNQSSPTTRIVKFFNTIGSLDQLGRYLLPVIVSIQGASISPSARASVNELNASIRDGLAEVIEQGQSTGEFDNPLPPAELAAITMALMDGMLLQWHRFSYLIDGSQFLRAGRRALLGALQASPPTS